MDKSGLEDQERTQKIAVDKANGDVIAAEGQLEIVKSQNQSDLSAAEIAVKLAELDLKKFTDPKGEYQQQLDDVRGRIKQAQSDLEMWKERASWSERMVQKKYMSSSQAEAEVSKLKSAELALDKVVAEERVLTVFTKERTETDLKSKVDEAKRALDRVVTQNKAKLNTALSDLKTKTGVLNQEEEKLKDLQEQITACVIVAPKEGMSVYYVPESSRFGSGRQTNIGEGEQVFEGQKLIRIPNLDLMLVNTKIHEAMVRRIVTGMYVDVRVDAFPDRILRGRVKQVSTIAAQQDWRSSADVKMYPTFISIEDTVPGLKPGMSAEVSVHVDTSDKPVLTVPVQAVVGGVEMGATRKLFVKKSDGTVEEREVVVGLNNDKVAEIRSGLVEGDEVVLNPKALLGDKAKTRQPSDFENKQPNSQGEPGNGAEKKGGPAASPGAGPGGPPSGPAGGPAPGSPGAPPKGGMPKGKFDPKMLQDPEVQKKMKEMGIDPKTFDPSKMKGGGGPPPAN